MSALAYPALPWADQLVPQLPLNPIIDNAAGSASPSPVRLVFQFCDQVRLENLAPRSNGDLLLTAVNVPHVYYLDPKASHPSAKLLHEFPYATGITGIVEIAPDIFIVAAGNWSSATFEATPGSFTAWSIDFNKPEPTMRNITHMPRAAALNGMTNLKGSPDIALIADSNLGAVWSLNTTTGEHKIAIQDPLFSNCTKAFPLGINGISTYGERLYFLNSALGIYGRIPITNNGSRAGEVEILARAGPAVTTFDDIAMDWEGNSWIATHPNALTEITVEGKQRNITANSNDVGMKQPTSARFGRGSKKAEKTLYMTTIGGQVFAVDTCLI